MVRTFQVKVFQHSEKRARDRHQTKHPRHYTLHLMVRTIAMTTKRRAGPYPKSHTVHSPIAGRIVGEAEADDISRKRDSDKSRVVRYRMPMLSFVTTTKPK